MRGATERASPAIPPRQAPTSAEERAAAPWANCTIAGAPAFRRLPPSVTGSQYLHISLATLVSKLRLALGEVWAQRGLGTCVLVPAGNLLHALNTSRRAGGGGGRGAPEGGLKTGCCVPQAMWRLPPPSESSVGCVPCPCACLLPATRLHPLHPRPTTRSTGNLSVVAAASLPFNTRVEGLAALTAGAMGGIFNGAHLRCGVAAPARVRCSRRCPGSRGCCAAWELAAAAIGPHPHVAPPLRSPPESSLTWALTPRRAPVPAAPCPALQAAGGAGARSCPARVGRPRVCMLTVAGAAPGALARACPQETIPRYMDAMAALGFDADTPLYIASGAHGGGAPARPAPAGARASQAASGAPPPARQGRPSTAAFADRPGLPALPAPQACCPTTTPPPLTA